MKIKVGALLFDNFMHRAHGKLHLFLALVIAVSTLSAVSVVSLLTANASAPAGPIYDFQATNYDASNGQWTNAGSISETPV